MYPRLYHSVALLLPDATVWLAGGNPSRGSYEPHVEVYQPPYLFQSDGSLATRPTITNAPASISYGNPFTVQTPDAASIASVVLIRNGTVTHAFGMDQRMVGMSFTAGSGTLTVTAPSNGNIAPPGYYMLFILNTAGVPSLASSVLVTSTSAPAPTVTSIAPNSGTTDGGTGVTITGTGFQAGATVSLGTTAATGVTVVSGTSITATTPPGVAGAVDVVVTNSDTQSGKLTQGFTYTAASNPAPTVTAISPASGPTSGGTPVTITGTGFLTGSMVKLGGTAATGVTVVSSTSITATTAAHPSGVVDVVVTNSDTQSGTLPQSFTYTAISNPTPTVTAISPDLRTKQRRNGGKHYGNRFPGRIDGELRRDGRDRRDRGEQHIDYSNDAGARRGRGERGSDQCRRTKRHFDEWFYVQPWTRSDRHRAQ